MIHFLDLEENIRAALEEILGEIPKSEELTGSYRIEHIEKGLHVYKKGKEGIIRYSDRCSLMRSIGVLAEHAKDEYIDISEAPKYEILGAMPDVSRNAVPTVETVKKFCRILALEGYNALMLYTEDTYELEGYPYFGHLRGRYTAVELKEMDAYAGMLGIELIPCIQTLAHLNAFFEWPLMEHLHDCNDIMLVGEERVYEMIDRMLETVSANIRSRKINVGLDEAFMLGGGKYLDRFGFTPRSKIMEAHLARVCELCKKYGYEPRMWSDMFFRMNNKGPYRIPGANLPQHIVDSVPPEMTLVYWDYVQPEVEGYNEMFRQHKVFHNPVAFAGGDASWYGPVPLNRLAQKCALAATKSIEENNIKEVYVTMWKDDGAACSLFSSLTSLFIYAEACWGAWNGCEKRANKRLEACTGMNAGILLDLEEINNLPGRQRFGETVANPSKYLFLQNVLMGKFDCHVAAGSGAHFAKWAKLLRAEIDHFGSYGYLLETLSCLCDVLAGKAEMGIRLTEAYRAGRREEIAQICHVEIPKLAEQVHAFHKVFRRQWLQENKSFGFDVMDIRVGGLLGQLETAQIILSEWLDGKRERVDELEASRLPYDNERDNGVILVNRWERIAGQDISNMFGI